MENVLLKKILDTHCTFVSVGMRQIDGPYQFVPSLLVPQYVTTGRSIVRISEYVLDLKSEERDLDIPTNNKYVGNSVDSHHISKRNNDDHQQVIGRGVLPKHKSNDIAAKKGASSS
jgi:hypothetical protein